MNVWWSQTMVQGVGWTLLHFLWQGLVIAALLAIGLRLLRRGPALHRYLAGCAALLLMTLAPLVTFQLVLKQDEPPPTPVVETMVPDAPAPVERATPRAVTLPTIVVTATREASAEKVSWRLEPLLPWLVGAWLLGVGGLSCRLFAGWLQIRRLRRTDAEALADGWPDKLAELARKLGVNRSLRLLRTACVEVPTVIGWLRPLILLPAACLTGLTPAQLESIIAHELAHIRRHDYLINLLQSAVETLLFYHPAVWWVSRRIREERENCCDDLVVEVCGDRVGYARALATLEELRPASAQLALAAGGAPLLQRIRRVLGQGERSAGRPAWPLAGLLVVLLLAVTAAGLREHRAVAANDGQAVASIGKKAASLKDTTLDGYEDPAIRWNPGTSKTNGPVPGMDIWTNVSQKQLNKGLFMFRSIGSNNLAIRDPWGRTYVLAAAQNAQTNSSQQSVNESNRVLFSRTVELQSRLDDLHQQGDSNRALYAGNEPRPGGTINWSVDGKNQLNQQWFWDGVTNSSNGTVQERIYTTNQDGMVIWLMHSSNVVDQTPAMTKSNQASFNQAWELYTRLNAERGHDTSNGVLYAQLNTNNQSGMFNWTVAGSNLLDQVPSLTKSNKIATANAILQVDDEWKVEQRSRLATSQPNPFNRTNLVYTGQGRQVIFDKLNRIRIDKVNYANLPLKDVLDDLMKIAKERDLDGKGINFFFDRPPAQQDTNATALPTELDVSQVRVNISLSDVRLADVLDAITKTSDRSVKYSVLDYAIVFALRGNGGPLEIRTFRVDPNTFIQGLESVTGKTLGGGATVAGVNVAPGGGGGTGGSAGGVGGLGGGVAPVTTSATASNIQAAVRQYFTAAGVDLSTNLGKIVIYNEHRGTLTIRATSQDLDLIEAAVQTLNQPVPEVNIKAKFVETTVNDQGALGFQWTLGGFKVGNATNQPGTNGPGNGGVTVSPGNAISITQNSVPATGLANQTNAPALATVTGILTDPQYRAVLQALDQRVGMDALSMNITTESGRQAQIRSGDVQNITVFDGTNSKAKEFHLGPALDVLAKVSADEFTVHLDLTPSMTEFLGYDKAGSVVPPGGSNAINAAPVPHFRVQQVHTTVNVWDGQTVVIGGITPYDDIRQVKDKVPLLGDIPLLGRLFQSEHSQKVKKNLMVFVTVTIINPDGTRYHSDDEMPFAKTSVPPPTGTNSVPKK